MTSAQGEYIYHFKHCSLSVFFFPIVLKKKLNHSFVAEIYKSEEMRVKQTVKLETATRLKSHITLPASLLIPGGVVTVFPTFKPFLKRKTSNTFL